MANATRFKEQKEQSWDMDEVFDAAWEEAAALERGRRGPGRDWIEIKQILSDCTLAQEASAVIKKPCLQRNKRLVV